MKGVDRSDLVVEFSFEENLADTSNNKFRAKAEGTVAFVEGRRGTCALFDGRGWVDTGLTQEKIGHEFTVECWVKPSAIQGEYADVFGNHISGGQGFVLQQDAGKVNHFLAAYGAGENRWVVTEAVPLLADHWTHVALVKTTDELRIHLNGVLAAATRDSAPVAASRLPIAVGLGYSTNTRCFRGLIDDFRIWNKALTNFDHAGIDPAAAREMRGQHIDATPRATCGAAGQSWTLNTDDTRLTVGVSDDGEMVVTELLCPATGVNWIANPTAFGFLRQAEVDGAYQALLWRFVDVDEDRSEGHKLTLQFACDNPAMEIESVWHARPGRGPVHHSMRIRNRSDRAITIGEQSTFDLDLAGVDTMWRVHSSGGTPDAVGVYEHSLAGVSAGRRYTVRTVPTGEFIPYAVFSAGDEQGVYFGMEWSFCRIEAVTLARDDRPAVRVRGANLGDLRTVLSPGETFDVRPGFIGAYRGDLDDAGNSLRRWLLRYRVPEILRNDPGYPKIQWNAFGATGKAPSSWDPVESKYYPLIDDIAPLGFEEVMIDVGWWQGGEPESDQQDWASGMRKAAEYAHKKGMRFGLYWTDGLDMANPEARRRRADRVRRLFAEYNVDMWRSDCTRGEVIGASYAAVRGFYSMVDELAGEIPGFQWENCSGGGRIKDFGAMRRAVKIFNSDTYSPIHVRQAFYDTSHAFHQIQIEGHLGSPNGAYRPRGVKGMRYGFRTMSMGAPEWFLDAPNGGNGCDPWTPEEKEALKACVATYKSRIRPLLREADLYHILPRPNGRARDAIEYYVPALGKGVVYLFQPTAEVESGTIRLKGLDATREYRLTFDDGSQPPCVKSGAELMEQGFRAILEGEEVSELIFFETVR